MVSLKERRVEKSSQRCEKRQKNEDLDTSRAQRVRHLGQLGPLSAFDEDLDASRRSGLT